MLNWEQTAPGQAWTAWKNIIAANERRRVTTPTFFAGADDVGRFRIDDVPPGVYEMSVSFDDHPVGELVEYKFTIPPPDEGTADEDVDLGTLTLED
jgi:hypothetical protein